MQLTFRQSEQLFHELSQLGRSAIPLARAFEMLGNSRSPVLARCGRALLAGLRGTGSPAAAFREAGFPTADVAVVEAAEQTGTLPENFGQLAEYYGRLARARSHFRRALAYPIFILHFAAFILPAPVAVIEGAAAYFGQVALFLGAVYAAGFAAWALFRAAEGALRQSPAAARLVTAIPFLGAYLRNLTAWRFAQVLSLHLRAGGSPLSGLEAAGAASGNAAYRDAVAAAVPRIQAGKSFAAALKRGRPLPEFLERALEIGEEAGRLDQETARAAEYFERQTAELLDLLARWIPKIIYIAVVLLIAWRIIGGYAQVTGTMNGLLNQESF